MLVYPDPLHWEWRDRPPNATARDAAGAASDTLADVDPVAWGAAMKAVARGERLPPADAAKPSFNSVTAVVRLLTPENRQLLALVRDRKPQSAGRAQPTLTRTLAKLEAAGFITMKTVGRRRTPSVAVKKIVVEPDPTRTAIGSGSPDRTPGTVAFLPPT